MAMIALPQLGRQPTFSQIRRRRRLMRLAVLALTGRGEGQSLSHVIWLFFLSLGYLALTARELGWILAPALALLCALVATALFDAIYLIIPDRLVKVMLVCAVILLTRFDMFDALAHIAAGFLAYGFLRSVAYAYEMWRGVPGIGRGDLKLFGVAGLVLGAPGLPFCLLAAVSSALLSLVIERRSQGALASDHALPFGPHLAFGLWLTFMLGSPELG